MENRWGQNGYNGRLYFLGLQNNCVWWLQPWNQKMFVPWKKSYDRPRQHNKSRDITVLTKIHIVKATVVMYGCESWTIKQGELQRIDVFRLWCWRRLLRVPWIARRSNQSILKEISPEYSADGWRTDGWSWNSNTLATWCEELTRGKSLWCWERLRAGEEGEDRGWDGWMASPIQWTWVWANSGR